MPSYLRYRIKRTSIDETPLVNGYSDEYKQRLVEMGVINLSTDINIKKYTCANLQKVHDGDQIYYICLLKKIEANPALKAGGSSEDASFVSGAEAKISDSSSISVSDTAKTFDWYSMGMVCKYANVRTGEALKISSPNPDVEDTVCFAQCNCYQPRGGIAISFFDGAVKSTGRFSYLANLDETGQEKLISDDWQRFQERGGGTLPNYFAGGLPTINTTIKTLIPNTPSGVMSHTFLMLNARASVVPCCYWERNEIIIYEPYFFRVVDLALAKSNVIGSQWTGYAAYDVYLRDGSSYSTWGRAFDASKRWTIKPIAEYIYQEGDYFDPSSEDGELKNRLLGRNYDVTLPSAGNNQRIIYVLRPEYTGGLVKNDKLHEDCVKFKGYHYHSLNFFNPQNCGYQDIEVRYKWGCLCNGGGSFDLDEGRACPYYYNPLMGDKTSKRYSKLENMYPGDSITAASILELMWLSKGGVAWTRAEWENVWKQPYLWTTVHDYMTSITDISEELPDDETKLSLERKKRALLPRILAQKTKIDFETGEITKDPVKILPVGSMTAKKYTSASENEESYVPNFPAIIKKIEFKPISSINIQWPRASFTSSTSVEMITDTQTYINRHKEEELEKKQVYVKIFTTSAGAFTSVLGSITSGYSDTVYCFNTAFLTDQTIKTEFLNVLNKGTSLTKEGQQTIYDLCIKLFSTRSVAKSPILDGVFMQTTVSNKQFIFRGVPLSTLDNINTIVVIAQHKSSRLDLAYVRIKPIFRHGYMFQEKTTFMSDWNAWEGYPEAFFNVINDPDLEDLGSSYAKLSAGSPSITAFANSENLGIPSDAGYTEWKSVVVGPPIDDSILQDDLVPEYIDQPNFAYKINYYNSIYDTTLGAYGKPLQEIGTSKWYTLESCSPYIIIIMDPSICNSFSEFMVYFLTGVVTDKNGEQKVIKFVPIIYSQIDRTYPGQTIVVPGMSESFNAFYFQAAKSSSKVQKDALGNWQTSDPGPNLETPETDTHPWVIVAQAVDPETYPSIPIWLYIQNPDKYGVKSIVPDKYESAGVIFDKSNTNIYMQYACINDIEYKYDHNKRYPDEDGIIKTRFSNHADGNVYRTVYNYTPPEDTISIGEGDTSPFQVDGYDSVTYGSKTMIAIWPWATIGCRDVEILYGWGNNVRHIKVRPSQSNCWGAGPAGYIEVDVGRGGVSSSENTMFGGYRINMPLCGDHDIRKGGGGSYYGPLYYPYIDCEFSSYNIMNDCLIDFSLALPDAAYQMYARGELPVSFERLRGPTYYTVGCAKVPQIFPAPCQTQYRYYNTIRDAAQNTFAGYSRSRGPVYPEEDYSNYLEDYKKVTMPKFGNMGREIWQLNIAYVSKKIYYTNERTRKEAHVLEVPAPECLRSINTVSVSGLNPYYYYLFSDTMLNEDVFQTTRITPDGVEAYIPGIPASSIRLLSKNTMVGYGHTTKEQSGLTITEPIYWAWPENANDLLSRGQRLIKEIPRELRQKDVTDTYLDDTKMLAIGSIICPPYKTLSNGEDISLGPEFDHGQTTVYYVIVSESEKWENGQYTYPYVWSKRVNKDCKQISNLTADPALKYKVTTSGLEKIEAPFVTSPNFITSKESIEITEDVGEMEMYDSSGVTPSGYAVRGLDFTHTGVWRNPDPNNRKKFEVTFEMPNVTISGRKLESINLALRPLLASWVASVAPVTLEITTQVTKTDGGSDSFINSVILPNTPNNLTKVPIRMQEKYTNYNFTFVFKTNTPKITDDADWEFKDGTGGGNLLDGSYSWSSPTPGLNTGYLTLGPYKEMWNGPLSSVISGMGFMMYKPTNMYPGLNLYDIDPVFLGKGQGKQEMTVSDPSMHNRFTIIDTNDILHTVRQAVHFDSWGLGLQYFELEFTSEFTERKDVSITVTASGYSANPWQSAPLEMSARFETPLSKTNVSCFTNFPIMKDLCLDFSFLVIQEKNEFVLDPLWGVTSSGSEIWNLIPKITLYVLYPGKVGELIKIDQTNFKVSVGESSSMGKYYEDLSESDFPNPQEYKLPVTPQAVTQLTNNSGKGGIWVESLGGYRDDDRKPFEVPGIQMPAVPFSQGNLKLKGRLWYYDKQYKNSNLVSTGNIDDGWYRDPSQRPASELFDMEDFQQKVFKSAEDLYPGTNTVEASAIIPYSDWETLKKITGAEFAEAHSDMSFDNSPLDDAFLEIGKYDISFTWHTWDWDEVSKYTFSSEEQNRYGPANGGVETWSAPGHAVDLDRSDEAWTLVQASLPRTYIAYRQGVWIIRFFSNKESVLAWDAPWPPPWAYDQAGDALDLLLYGSDCPPGQEEACNATDPRTRSMLNVDYIDHVYNKRYRGDQNEEPYMEWLAQKALRTQQLAMAGMPGGNGWDWVGLNTDTWIWESDDYAWPGADL